MCSEEYKSSPILIMGNKHKLLKWLIPFFPKNINTFYDMFGGSGVVGLNVQAQSKVYNEQLTPMFLMFRMFHDIDGDILLNEMDRIVSQFELEKAKDTEHNTQFYTFRKHINERCRLDPVYLYVYTRYAFSHNLRYNRKGDLNNSFFHCGITKKYRTIIMNIKQNLNNYTSIINGNALDFDYDQVQSGDFVYFDPPYTNTDAPYLHNGAWTLEHENKLLQIIDNLSARGVSWGLSNVAIHKGIRNTHLLDWAEKRGYKVETKDILYGVFKRNKSIECYIHN